MARFTSPAERGPGIVPWSIALLGIALPWLAAPMLALGLWRLAHGERHGAALVAAGGVMLILDVAIDFWLYRSASMAPSPDAHSLNSRGAAHIGRIVRLDRPIAGHRGRIRLGDTFWAVEGADLPAGRRVRVTAAKGTVLQVVEVPEETAV